MENKTNLSVYRKLNEARTKIQNTTMKKTGKNTYSGYDYFTLADILPEALKIFTELNLSGVISFTDTTASMTITDLEGGGQIVITSPMGSANLKGCHEVQNIGAVETYQRRYLWVTALEIIEHDELDSTTGRGGDEPVKRITGAEVAKIKKMAIEAGTPIENVLKFAKVDSLEDLTPEKSVAVKTKLQEKINESLTQPEAA